MDLPRLDEILSSPKKDELFLALKIEANEIKSAVWSFVEGKAEVLALGERQEWDEPGENKEELMVSCDSSIATAVAKLKEENRLIPRRLVVGLPYSWIQTEKIKKEKLEILHFVTKKLTLTPIGFVITPEALTYYLKKKEKDFLAIVLIYLGAKQIEVTLVDGGKVVESQTVSRSDSLALDVEEGILRFTNKNLPPRILLYNSGEDLEVARQTLISYPWQPPSESEKKAGFLHLPRVEILPENFDMEAIVFAGGEEFKKSLPRLHEEVVKEKEEEEEKASEVVEEVMPRTLEKEIEFIEGEDILAKIPQPPLVETEAVLEREEQVVSKTGETPAPQIKDNRGNKWQASSGLRGIVNLMGRGVKKPFSLVKGLLGGILSSKNRLSKKPILFYPALVLVGILILSFLSLYFLVKAEIILTVEPKVIEKSFVFGIDANKNQIDQEKMIIPARSVSVQVEGSKSTAATGKKTIGEKAKGEVTIFNRTDSLKKILAGTILVSPEKLKFVLNEEIQVASKTPDLSSGIDRWGETKATVTAFDIGAQYNLGTGSLFSFENISATALLAKNQLAFLGGTSRQITVVSKEDQEKLLSDLTKELNQKSRGELGEKITSQENLVLETMTTEIKTKKFDHEVQEEVSDLNLNLTIENRVLVFKKEDLLQLTLNILGSEMINQFEVDKDRSQFEVLSAAKDNPLEFSVKAKIAFKPKIDSDKIVNDLKGKSMATAQKYLSGLSSVKTIKIKTFPGIFAVFSRLPFKKENIIFSFKTE